MAKKDNKMSGFVGGAVGVVALVMLITVGVQNGSMKGLNGRSLVDIEPAAGEETVSEEVTNDIPVQEEEMQVEEHSSHGHSHDHGDPNLDWDYAPPEPTECGVYEHWIAKLFDEEAIKATGKVYRIIGLGDAMTMDHNPERINVYLNQDDLVLDVKCG